MAELIPTSPAVSHMFGSFICGLEYILYLCYVLWPSLSLLLQQCPTCLVRLSVLLNTYYIYVMFYGRAYPYFSSSVLHVWFVYLCSWIHIISMLCSMAELIPTSPAVSYMFGSFICALEYILYRCYVLWPSLSLLLQQCPTCLVRLSVLLNSYYIYVIFYGRAYPYFSSSVPHVWFVYLCSWIHIISMLCSMAELIPTSPAVSYMFGSFICALEYILYRCYVLWPSLSLLLQLCPTCLVRLSVLLNTYYIDVMFYGRAYPYFSSSVLHVWFVYLCS